MAKILGQLVHVGRGGCRSLTEVIDNIALAAGALNGHEADAAESAHPGLDNADGERGCNGGVDRVAAPIEDVISGSHGPGVLGGDHLTTADRLISRNTQRCLGVRAHNLARFLMSRTHRPRIEPPTRSIATWSRSGVAMLRSPASCAAQNRLSIAPGSRSPLHSVGAMADCTRPQFLLTQRRPT